MNQYNPDNGQPFVHGDQSPYQQASPQYQQPQYQQSQYQQTQYQQPAYQQQYQQGQQFAQPVGRPAQEQGWTSYNPGEVDEAMLTADHDTVQAGAKRIMSRVFLQLFTGLLLTAVAAVFFAFSGITLSLLLTNPSLIIVTSVIQLAVVIVFSVTLRKAKPALSTALFYVYSILTAFTLSVYFFYFELGSILYSFGITALVFGAMALWGHNTKKDLTPLGAAGHMLLFGAIIVSLVNLLLYFVAPGFATVVDMILNYVILAVFVGLTAYDMQKIRKYAIANGALTNGPEAVAQQNVVATYGALSLYLDFINIFIRILSIFGRRK